MKTNPSFSFKWATILFNYKDYQIKVRNGMWSSVEEIWVNDELKHRQASWKWRTQNSIKLSNGETLDFDFGYEKLKGKRFSISKGIISKSVNGAQRWNRTTDTRIFSPLLYRLSYLGNKRKNEL